MTTMHEKIELYPRWDYSFQYCYQIMGTFWGYYVCMYSSCVQFHLKLSYYKLYGTVVADGPAMMVHT
jgi:hypothetical protein